MKGFLYYLSVDPQLVVTRGIETYSCIASVALSSCNSNKKGSCY